MKKVLLIMLVCLFAVSGVFAGEIDILVQKLMEKGVLTGGEAQVVLTETKEELRKSIAKGDEETLPSWIQKMSLKGDLRLRYQWEDKGSYERIRERLRLRVKGEANVTNSLKVGFGLATGGTDPRSTNQTFENTFETKGIQLDYAYADYTASGRLSVLGGKVARKTMFWAPSDLLWDGDITLEGAGALYNTKAGSMKVFVNGGIYILDEVKKSNYDPSMTVIQPGISAKLSDNASLKFAGAYYGLDNIKGYILDHSAGTNSSDASGGLMYDYDSTGAGFELKFSDTILPLIGLFGEYIQVSGPSEDNTGSLYGVAFGDSKVSSAGQWQVKASYRTLAKDGWLDCFPDSDAYGGDTGVKGSEIAFSYGLSKNVSLGMDYYDMDEIDVDDSNKKVLQLDCAMKF